MTTPAGSIPGTAALRETGKLFALAAAALAAMFRRPFQGRELVEQFWFIASVTILPTALVSIPFGAVIALQVGSLTEQLGGQIAYTLSRTERTSGGETFAADSDRTHVVHVVLGYELLPGLHASARLTAYSGRPFTLSAGKPLRAFCRA